MDLYTAKEKGLLKGAHCVFPLSLLGVSCLTPSIPESHRVEVGPIQYFTYVILLARVAVSCDALCVYLFLNSGVQHRVPEGQGASNILALPVMPP
jgi:hypothetical protein